MNTIFFQTQIAVCTLFDFISPPVSSQRQIDSIYRKRCSSSDLVSRTVALTKLILSDRYINWIVIYFLIANDRVHFRKLYFRSFFSCSTNF